MPSRWPDITVREHNGHAKAETAMPCDKRLHGTATGIQPDATKREARRQLQQRATAHLASCAECKRRASRR